MRVGQVVGTVVAARKDERLAGSKLLLVALLNASGEPFDELVALDTVGAGEGEIVLVTTGSSARHAVSDDTSPTDAAVVAIVDETYRS